MTDDVYAGIAARYDRFHGRFCEHAEQQVAFFEAKFAEYGVRSVLDCACGTGHHLHLFHTLGLEVAGSDLSPSMLREAAKNLRAAHIRVPLRRADYRELAAHYGRRFDAVVCLSSSILHMPDEVQVLAALRSMRGVLRPGGIIVLSQGTTDKQWEAKPRFLLALDDAALTRLFVIDYHGAGARYNIVDICRSGPKPEVKTWSIDYDWVLLRDDYLRLLQAAGFCDVELYGSWKGETYSRSQSDRLIAVAAVEPDVPGAQAEERSPSPSR